MLHFTITNLEKSLFGEPLKVFPVFDKWSRFNVYSVSKPQDIMIPESNNDMVNLLWDFLV